MQQPADAGLDVATDASTADLGLPDIADAQMTDDAGEDVGPDAQPDMEVDASSAGPVARVPANEHLWCA
ncbi:MAG: hypothetical protein R3E66_04620 [bacterium]